MPGLRRTSRKLGRWTRLDALLGQSATHVSPPAITDHRRLEDRRSLLPPFRVILPLLVGRILAGGNLVEGAPLRFHPHVGITREHGARDGPAMLIIIWRPARRRASLVFSLSPPFARRFRRPRQHTRKLATGVATRHCLVPVLSRRAKLRFQGADHSAALRGPSRLGVGELAGPVSAPP